MACYFRLVAIRLLQPLESAPPIWLIEIRGQKGTTFWKFWQFFMRISTIPAKRPRGVLVHRFLSGRLRGDSHMLVTVATHGGMYQPPYHGWVQVSILGEELPNHSLCPPRLRPLPNSPSQTW